MNDQDYEATHCEACGATVDGPSDLAACGDLTRVCDVCCRRAARKEEAARLTTKAAEVWAAMDANEKTGVRFGMFPAGKMAAVEKEGFDGHKFTCALMDVAKADGGMRA